MSELKHSWKIWWTTLAMLGACTVDAAGTGATPPPRTITLERHCFGCAFSTRFELKSDGTAVLTRIGNARAGTEDQVLRGTLAASEVDRIVQLAARQGFFEMKESYDLEGVQDGAWSTLTITRDGRDKTVFRREDAGPAALGTLEAEIDAVQRRTTLSPQAR